MPTITDAGSNTFPVSDRNRLRRLHGRGRYDRVSVQAILDAAMVCHVAYVIDGQPSCMPTTFWREADNLYWHGSSAGRMFGANGLPSARNHANRRPAGNVVAFGVTRQTHCSSSDVARVKASTSRIESMIEALSPHGLT
jgi:hypothetical protein